MSRGPRGHLLKKIQEMVADVKQVESQLRELTPSSGAYFNEVHHDFFWYPSLPTRSLANVQGPGIVVGGGLEVYVFWLTTTRR
jgi:hypothetical protein